ncbi:MAG: PBP1A family penicillin-binding protein [Deltaproteobacteria bacterium]|nr:PBP1A family penicillin-binding protein [Deltaproteobacteria bacterium]
MKRFFKFLAWFSLCILILAAATGGGLWYLWSSNLPYIGSLKEYNPPIITEIYSDDGEIIGRFWDEKRIVLPLDQFPKHLIQAFIAAEDARFFEHEGVDVASIIRAFFKNIQAGKKKQGGSTITQQVTRSLLLKNPARTYRRKAREAILSLQIEKKFSKERILFLYLNQIYLGHGAYGVEAAARTYFGKNALELDLAESALLAGLPQAPSRYSIIQHFDRAKARQKYVLNRMHEEGYITGRQAQEAFSKETVIQKTKDNPFEKAPYFTEYIRKYLEKKYGRELLYRGGLRVHTTLDLKMQQAAQRAIKKGLLELDKREGYRGPLRHVSPEGLDAERKRAAEALALKTPSIGDVLEAVVESVDDEHKEVILGIGNWTGVLPLANMKWARKPNPKVPYYAAAVKKPSSVLERGDAVLVRITAAGNPPHTWKVSLEQKPEVQAAMFCLETESGRVKVMVGGRDFSGSQFNRAIQARRQPGSAFKPIIYASALDWGMNPASIIIDAPYISTKHADGELWKPKNYKKKFYGRTLFRSALIKSRNVITVKILKDMGVKYAINYARLMGIEADLKPDLSLALGSSGLSLAELTRAYSVFPNGGVLMDPFFIDRILDRRGQVIEENQTSFQEAISPDTAYVMTDLLKGVIKEGTGWRVKALKRPAAGKTGTTNDLRDAWFLGFSPEMATGVWVGYDDRKSMGKGETGSRAASPIWLNFMSEVLKDLPVKDFPVPEGVVFVKIDKETGLLASPYSKKTVFQAFREGREPKTYTPKPEAAKSGQFSRFDMDFDREEKP